MAIFLLFGFITFFFIIGLLILRDEFIVEDGVNKVHLKCKNFIEIITTRQVIFTLAVLFVITSVTILTFLAVASIFNPDNDFYQLQEILTSNRFSKGLLGVVFGALLASWLARNYHNPAHFKLTMVQRLEGFAILLLIVLGTTSITFDELIRGFNFDGSKINFQLSAALSPTNKGSGEASVLSDDGGEKGSSDFLEGFKLISGTLRDMEKDLGYIKLYGKTTIPIGTENYVVPVKNLAKAVVELITPSEHQNYIKKFEKNFMPLIDCTNQILSVTGDQHFIHDNISTLRAPLAAVYINLLAPKNNKTIDTARTALNVKVVTAADILKKFSDVLPKSEQCKEFDQNKVGLPDFEENFSVLLRPYLGTIYASMLYMDGQRVQAIYFLDDVINKIVSSNDNKKIADLKSSQPEFWFTSRAIFNLLFMVEDYFEKDNINASIEIRKLYLNRVQEYIDILAKAAGGVSHQKFYPSYKFGDGNKNALSQNSFQSIPEDQEKCLDAGNFKSEEELRFAAGFSYLIVGLQSVYAYRALADPDFELLHLKKAGGFVDAVANVDIRCANKLLGIPNSGLSLQKAEFLYVYARYRLKVANLKKNIWPDYKKWVRKQIFLAQEASKLALELISKTNSNSNVQGYSSDTPKISLVVSGENGRQAAKELKRKLDRLIKHTNNWLAGI